MSSLRSLTSSAQSVLSFRQSVILESSFAVTGLFASPAF
jgi:hypothetical protein